MADIQLRSLQQIIGSMVAKLLAETDINDANRGSVAMTLLEAAASSDFQQEAKLLQLLTLKQVDRASGLDLENLAIEMGLTPSRIGAAAARAFVTVQDTSITRIASTVYAGVASPVIGDTKLYVVNAADFPASGTVYLGRGTPTSEVVDYVSTTEFGSYWVLNLAAPLGKDHLIGEELVVAQGGDREVPAGSMITTAGGGLSPSVRFRILNQATILDGEDTVSNLEAVCDEFGINGNVGIGKINQFLSAPFSTAKVVNTSAASGGRDAEIDAELRERIKDRVHVLSAGTERAVVRAVIGQQDSTENKRVVSAYFRKPTSNTDQAILFIDDGTGFAPIFSGIAVESIVTSASGTEKFFQLQKWPVVKAQLPSVGLEPFTVQIGSYLRIEVDGEAAEAELFADEFQATSGSTLVFSAQRVAEEINKRFPSFAEARAKNGQLFITPLRNEPDWIRVGTPATGINANQVLKFPTSKQYTLKLYKNDVLLEKNGTEAFIQSKPRGQWPSINTSTPNEAFATIQLKIDGILGPKITLTDAIFDNTTGVSANKMDDASIADWVLVLNQRLIGVTCSATDSGTFLITSNKGKDSAASVELVATGDQYDLSVMLFEANVKGVGQEPQYKLNRLLGQIELSTPLAKGDSLKAGTANTRGRAQTESNSVYDLSLVYDSPAEMVLIADGDYVPVEVGQSGTWTFAVSGNDQRITATAGKFNNVNVGDYCHLYASPRNDIVTGSLSTRGIILMVKEVASNGSWVKLYDANPKSGSFTPDGQYKAATFFRSYSLPQLVRLPVSTTVTSQMVVDAINDQTTGITAQILDSGRIEISTKRFDGDRALSIPSLKGRAINLGLSEGVYTSNDPHTATIESDDLAGFAEGRIKVTAADTSDPYTSLVASGSTFTDADSNKPISAYLGSSSKVLRQTKDFVSSTELELRNELPKPNSELGVDFVGAQYTGVEFSADDNMVFIIDNDADRKTFNIPMYIEGDVSGPFTPNQDQFDAVDSSGEALATSVRWDGHRFADYRAWFQAKATLTGDTNASIKLKSQEFGPNGEHIQVGFIYPQLPNQEIRAAFDVDGLNDKISISATLASGTERTIGLLPNRKVLLSAAGSTSVFRFLPPVSLSTIQIGDVLTVRDTGFTADAQGSYRINQISNYSDAGNAFEYSNPFEITASNLPNFTVQAGDLITVGSNIIEIVGVIDQQTYTVDQDALWTGLLSGSVSRILLQTKRVDTPTEQTVAVAASNSIRIFDIPASVNLASALIDKINNTAGVKDLVVASNATGSNGSGAVTESTLDQANVKYIALQNGESFISDSYGISPGLRLKTQLPVALEYGDKVRLIPATPQNIKDHLSRKQISGLSVVADIELVDGARKLQVSSKTAGGLGQVFAVGGRALGENLLAIRSGVQRLSSTRAMVELDRSSIEFLAPGQTIKISQPFRAVKEWVDAAPTATDTIQITNINNFTGESSLELTAKLATIYPYSQGTPTWAVRYLGRNITRYEIVSGSATIPSDLRAGDWVFVGDGTDYAGFSTSAEFSAGNRGWWSVRATDNANYFDVEGKGIEEMVETEATSFIFAPYHSARVGDQIRLGFDMPISTANKGSYSITEVVNEYTVKYINKLSVSEGPMALTANGAPVISVLDQGFSTYRKVVMVAPKPSDPSQRSLVVIEPGYDMSLVSENQGARISLPLRLGFGSDPVAGVNGYNFWTGLKRRVQRVVDGFEASPSTFPGVAAAGVSIEVREPQITRVSVGMKIKTRQGVALTSISDAIKSAIAGYINSLGLGDDVVLSEVIRIVQEVPGVDAIVLQNPSPTGERIVVGDNTIARINTADISLS